MTTDIDFSQDTWDLYHKYKNDVNKQINDIIEFENKRQKRNTNLFRDDYEKPLNYTEQINHGGGNIITKSVTHGYDFDHERHCALFNIEYKTRNLEEINQMILHFYQFLMKVIELYKNKYPASEISIQKESRYNNKDVIDRTLKFDLHNPKSYVLWEFRIGIVGSKPAIRRTIRMFRGTDIFNLRRLIEERVEYEFAVKKPNMCLFSLMYNHIDIYLDELPLCIQKIE